MFDKTTQPLINHQYYFLLGNNLYETPYPKDYNILEYENNYTLILNNIN